MALSLKNVETERLARELAELRGVSLVAAVTDAVKQDLAREKRNQQRNKLMAEWLMEISRETGPMMNDGKTSTELIEELYDPDTGLPR
ncbi:MAG: type II toxin-antitoxin system VapB family antitoxin [Terracidiphilus sp.]